MTTTEKIKALEDQVATLRTMVLNLGARLAALDSEHAETRRWVLAHDPEGTQTSVELRTIETQTSVE